MVTIQQEQPEQAQGSQQQKQKRQHVSFGEVRIRKYDMILGENPAVGLGAPVCLDWEFEEQSPVKLDTYEQSRMGKRRTNPQHFYLSYYRRKEILDNAGVSSKEFYAAEQNAQRIQRKRRVSCYLSFPFLLNASIRASAGRRKNKRFIRRYRKQIKKQRKLEQQQRCQNQLKQ